MDQLQLKYGCNPNQKPARVYVPQGQLPLEVLNGQAGYINLLDALNGWQLVRELHAATGKAAAASFKHVSPAGVAVANPLSDTLRAIYFTPDDDLSDIATAYARARGTDRVSSFGDMVALSEPCDGPTARLIAREVSDGVIAPGYTPEAMEILKGKRNGSYLMMRIDPDYCPPALEAKTVFGITFEQNRNDLAITGALLNNIPTANKELPPSARQDLLVALITLKYTQSNSVCYAKDGQTIGVGAGQQSRIHCTRLAGNKADHWFLRQHPKTLALPFLPQLKRVDKDNLIDLYVTGDPALEQDWQASLMEKPAALTAEEKQSWIGSQIGVALGSDAFFPFGDNIERAHRSGVSYVAQSGGSIRDDHVIAACDRLGIVMAFTGVRLFHH